ncbi:cytosine-specific methyltransferase [Terasakiella brassicae]|uniref:Cytosine-specific methyltransferase n=1 Tax=Terasakiella brassicae TaxID=1634917 RepID=A0A917FFY4_9PROT|nr:DNA cytosine methyltransferase [Terasakiella brassicae]GGF72149.1 cytosine-specific methyltransferase [Terasakiella brassicae]
MTSEGSKKLKVVSMFSGCGGMDLGFKQAGYDIVWANDLDEDACETYSHNIGKIIPGDVTKLEIPNVKNLDVLVAGFPCQPFSNAGSRKGTNDPRGVLYQQTFKFIENLDPKVVVFENVRGLLSTKTQNGKLIDEIVDTLTNKYGYHVAYRLLNFSHFGVPQNRIRLIIIAVKNKNYIDHIFPEVTEDKDLSIQATLKGVSKKMLNQNELMRLNPQAIYYGSMIPEGGSWKDLEYDVLPDRWKKIRDNMAKYHYPNFFRRYARSEIQGTITAAFKPENAGVWHPTEDRIYSVREIARFQTFPDQFEFLGRSIKSKYQQIGNAVPPHMAKQIAEQLKHYLFKTQISTLTRRKVESTELNVNQPIHKQKIFI